MRKILHFLNTTNKKHFLLNVYLSSSSKKTVVPYFKIYYFKSIPYI